METKNTGRNILLAFIAVLLLAGTFSGGLLVGWLIPSKTSLESSLPSNASTPDLSTQAGTPAELTTLFKPFWETWQIIHDQYIDQPVDDIKLMQGAISGMLNSLGDKYSGYMNPDEYKQATMPLDGNYEGIGAWVDSSGEWLTVTKPMPGSPAEKAGLLPGDEIIKVNGKDMTGVDPVVVLRSVLGPAGTEVVLTIHRPDPEEVLDFTITRAVIDYPSIESKMLENNIGYIILSTFGETTGDDLKVALKQLLDQNPKGLILDLRYNSGGYLTTAIEVISQFIPEGIIMIEEDGTGKQTTYQAIPGGLATKIPLVVLVNEGSASASEITVGAIQDFGRGKIVGTTTYGKGRVQNWIPLEDDQGAIRVTIARWLTPKGRQINGVGITPDIVVEFTQADIDAKHDVQLEKAIEVLLVGIE